MERPDPSTWFLGDLGDPFVAAIADRLPANARRVPCAGNFPDAWPGEMGAARTIVVHRAILSETDLARLKGFTEQPTGASGRPRIVLCVGPHARYHDLQRWSAWVDAVLPEATAPETIGRHALSDTECPRPAHNRGEITLVSGLEELRLALGEACEDAGYTVSPKRDWPGEPASGLVVWDVPVLDDEWPIILAREASRSRIVALIGFADRVSVGIARAQGAAACLDLPCDPADIVYVLDRLSAEREPAGSAPADPPKRLRRHQASASRPKASRSRSARASVGDSSQA